MRPALQPGDWLLARRLRRPPARGAVVVLNTAAAPDLSLVKRVIGLPGERVAVAEGQVHIDGTTLAEPWVSGRTTPDLEITVPDGQVWVLGDNRGRSSADSRSIGPVPLDDVGWQVLGVYWPSSRVGLL